MAKTSRRYPEPADDDTIVIRISPCQKGIMTVLAFVFGVPAVLIGAAMYGRVVYAILNPYLPEPLAGMIGMFTAIAMIIGVVICTIHRLCEGRWPWIAE